MTFARRWLLAAAGVMLMGGGCRTVPAPSSAEPAAATVRVQYLAQIDSLTSALAALETTLADAESPTAVRHAFALARTRYKHIEALVEYYLPTTADLINGPALDEMEENDPEKVIVAEGFQPLEEIVFDSASLADSSARRLARTHVQILGANVLRVRDDARNTHFTDAAIFDAARLELMRIATLGISGFDSPVALRSLPEAIAALEGIEVLLRPYRDSLAVTDKTLAARLAAQLAETKNSLGAAGDFNAFDRLQFITSSVRPLAGLLLTAQTALHIPLAPERRGWRMTTATIFEAGAFDVGAFAPGLNAESSVGEVELGRALFADVALSRNGDRSCVTCHQPGRSFADGQRRSLPGAGASPAFRRNAPTLVNSALQNAQFADLRVPFLEDQVADVLANAEEMHGSMDGVVRALASRDKYRAAFGRVYGETRGVSSQTLRRALAAYLRTLTALDAPFDRYVRGDPATMSADAQRGFSIFMGKGKCGTCHFAPLFNGVIPPMYQKTESEVLGVPASAIWRGARLDPDSGRSRVTRLPIHLHAFKTPSLRNVALTAPYMHNGVYRSLDEVIEFYDRGGGAGLGIHIDNQTLPREPLELSRPEKRQLIAFLHTLTDTTSIRY